MAKPNFRQQKRQKELVRKERQSERLQRRGESPPVDESAALITPLPVAKPEGGGS